MRGIRLLSLAAACCLLAGCSEDPVSDDAPLTPAGFIDGLSTVASEKGAECSPSVSAYVWSIQRSATEKSKLATEKGLEAGRLTFDAASASRCLEQVRSFSCEQLVDSSLVTGDCGKVFQGTVAPGGSCYLGDECIGGWCDLTTCPGKCVAYSKDGEACRGGLICSEELGLYCGSDDLCHQRGAIGAACEASGECLSGLACVSGKCAQKPAPATAGEECGTCAAGYFCDAPTYAELGTCKATLAAGATCGATWGEGVSGCGTLACTGFVYSHSTETTTTGTCTVWSEVGGACTEPVDGATTVDGCKFGLVCDQGTCKQPPTSGPCAEHYLLQCEYLSAYCDPNDQCAAKKAIGQDCEGDLQCVSDQCEQGKCAAACAP